MRELSPDCLRQEESGDGAKKRTEAKDKEGEDGGELGKVDHHGGEEDGDASHNLAKGNLNSRIRMGIFVVVVKEDTHPLPSDDRRKDFAAVLEADEVGPVHSHPANQSHREAHPKHRKYLLVSCHRRQLN